MRILAEFLLLGLLALGVVRYAVPPLRGRLLNVLKAWFTVRAFWLLLAHPVQLESGARVAAWRVILDTVRGIDAGTFALFVALAAGVKLIGILSSMLRWQLLLRGQKIELPFRHVFGAFLIGRFIGTFLPGTAGLDGYKLYDAARFSGRTVEATAATLLEKLLGFAGIFLSFLVALPFGVSIFGERAGLVAALTVPLALVLIAGLLALVWFPGLVEWGLRVVPLPGKASLQGLVMRLAHAAAAYRNTKGLVLATLGLSFLVHFTTAAMYYFTALAIGAQGARFWPIAFGSSIQIFATVVSPFTIAGAGIREAAQYVLLGSMIGPGAAIVSAALGFWAAEALTLFGGIFWWLRGADYRPAWCLVEGVQVDYAEAARDALALGPPAPGAQAAEPAPPLRRRLALAVALGLGAGVLAGVAIGAAETAAIAREGLGGEAQVLWYAPLAYAAFLGLLGAAGGAVFGLLPLDRQEIRGWTPTLVWLGAGLPLAFAISFFRVRRDLFHEQPIPLPWLAGLALGGLGLALALLFLGRHVFASRLGAAVRPLPALALLALVSGGGALAAARVAPAPPPPAAPPPVPPALAAKPNLILIIVDTLRADHLSCYGSPNPTPHLCALAEDGGTRYLAFSHASWTKPSIATILTSLLPSSHGAISKTARLSPNAHLVSEALQASGYATGGIVSNINLAPSFGFDHGWDEYQYLAPDYLAGAQESSSKLLLYQLVRKVFFKLRPGHRVTDYYQDSTTVNAHAFDWLERHRRSRFFLFLHYMDPHDPYFRHPYDGYAIARVENDDPSPGRAAEMEQLYSGEVRHVDESVGKLVERLRALGLYDDSVIVLTADHGEEFQEHGGWWHGTTLYDEQIHVPLLIKWPKGAAAAPPVVEDHLVRLLDVAPTLLGRAGVEIPPAMQGVDLTRPDPDPSVRQHFAEEDLEGNVLRALRTFDWKWIEANAGNPRGLPTNELFHLAQDPAERRNLVQTDPAKAAELRGLADAQQSLARSRHVEGGSERSLSAAEEARLRALGYIR